MPFIPTPIYFINGNIKTKVILLIILGIIIGGLLFIFGEYNDAPGVCAIGTSVGFVLIILGVNHSGIIKNGLLASILLLFFGAFLALITTSILLDGEFGDKPWYAAIVFVIALVLFFIGLLRIRVFFKSKS